MTTTLHITLDRDLKEASQHVARQLGLDISSIVRGSLLNLVRTGEFSVANTPRMTPYLEGVIAEAQKEENSYTFSSPEDSIDFLRKRMK